MSIHYGGQREGGVLLVAAAELKPDRRFGIIFHLNTP